ncbi:MAG TPA: AIR synthase-related protein, partial [Pyrinomonadaceae bacterium]|nr:AIR synthase-related protein [Pyrinomonadaceae bacterium]
GILPTPVIGMVGLMEDVRRVLQPGFKKFGDVIALLGTTQDDLSISEYAASVAGISTADMIANGKVPELDLKRELAVQQACLEAAEAGLLVSAHDCADGGLAVALAESCFSSLGKDVIGADVDLKGTLHATTLLFSESPSRIIISFDREATDAIRRICETHNAPLAILGKVGGSQLRIAVNSEELIAADIADLESTWRNALSKSLKAEALVAG